MYLRDYSTPYCPQGTFVVVLMDVTNHGLRSDEVGQHNSFKVQDSAGRIFDLAGLNVHQAAEYTYQRESLSTLFNLVLPCRSSSSSTCCRSQKSCGWWLWNRGECCASTGEIQQSAEGATRPGWTRRRRFCASF